MQITEFREHLIFGLLGVSKRFQSTINAEKHKLVEEKKDLSK